jgi:hypothetical protein
MKPQCTSGDVKEIIMCGANYQEKKDPMCHTHAYTVIASIKIEQPQMPTFNTFTLAQHLRSRGMEPKLYSFTGYGEDCVEFPLYNFAEHMTGFLRYRPEGQKGVRNAEDGKYYTYITKGEVGVFGLESLGFSNTIYLVSGLFKASTLHRLGYAALHVSSVSPEVVKRHMYLMNRPYFGIGDNDKEGEEFADKYGGWQSPRDVDEMPDEQVHGMLEYYGKASRSS